MPVPSPASIHHDASDSSPQPEDKIVALLRQCVLEAIDSHFQVLLAVGQAFQPDVGCPAGKPDLRTFHSPSMPIPDTMTVHMPITRVHDRQFLHEGA